MWSLLVAIFSCLFYFFDVETWKVRSGAQFSAVDNIIWTQIQSPLLSLHTHHTSWTETSAPNFHSEVCAKLAANGAIEAG